MYSDSLPIPLVGLYIHPVAVLFIGLYIHPVAVLFIPMVFLSMTVGPTLDALLRFGPTLTRTDKPVSGPICDTMTISKSYSIISTRFAHWV